VEPRAHLEPHLADGLGDRDRTPDRRPRAVEDREEPVAGGVHLVSLEPLQLAPDDRVVPSHELAPPLVSELARDVGRADDVGEQQGGEPACGSSS
jgi:hypothetical protein